MNDYVDFRYMERWIDEFNGEYGIFGKKFPTKIRVSNDLLMGGSIMEVENEFGSKEKAYFGIQTIDGLKKTLKTLQSKLIEKDLDKYKEQILKQSAKQMTYGEKI